MIRQLLKNFIWALLIVGATSSCDPWFAFSPYEARVDEALHNTTRENLERIKATDAGDSKPFKIAVIADTHYHFGKLADALQDIKRRGEYEFILVVGDMSENGLKQEFVYFRDAMEETGLPYLTVIGNHDYLANGELVYRQMFGAYNYSFVFNNVKFVMFDNTTYESGKEPDFEWFAAELSNNRGYDHVIPVAHVPPYDGQMKEYESRYHRLMVESGIHVSLHGHKHDFSIAESYGEGVQYVTVSSPQKRTYSEVEISPMGITVKKIDF